jgi:hypothetical protein
MSILPSFLGFTLGAAIGTIATATTGAELWDEASKWLEFRWRKVYSERQTWRFPALFSEALNLLQIEILIILLCIWIFGLLWAIFLTPAWDHQSHIQYIIGSLVGTAAAPWIWLHFSRTFETRRRGDDELARYRFVSYMLGATLLVALLQPYLATWLTRANKIEGFGVALNFTVPRNDRGANIPPAGQLSPGLSTTTSRLASATSLAHLVATGHKQSKPGTARKTIEDVKADMEGFSDLSVIDRDKVYISYFHHEHKARDSGTEPLRFPDLKNYVAATEIKFDETQDKAFLDNLANLSECISLYAENLRDFRLFLVDSGSFLRGMLVNVATQWSRKRTTGLQKLLDRLATGDAKPNFKIDLKDARPLAKEVVDALEKSNVVTFGGVCSSVERLIGEDSSGGDTPGRGAAGKTAPAKATGSEVSVTGAAGKDAPATQSFSVAGIGRTPYPAYLIAHYLAAIDSVESGILVLRDWMAYQRQRPDRFVQDDPKENWYVIRAMLTSSQLPYRFGSVSPTHRSLVKFQQETTDRIGALLGVYDARTWRALCKRLSQRGLHSRIGRYLALTYADERNYLFELLRPEDFGLPAPGEKALISTEVSPSVFLEEAEAILETPECFSDVPRFNRKLIGQYSLNAAQLRYSVRASAQDGEKPALTQKIRADLARAQQLDTDPGREDALDLLRQADEFEPHRARLARFRKALDSESDKD